MANFALLAGYLAAQSSSKSLVVSWSVGLLVGLSDNLVQIWPLEYHMRVSDWVTEGSIPKKKQLPFGHCPKVALIPPPHLFWTPVELICFITNLRKTYNEFRWPRCFQISVTLDVFLTFVKPGGLRGSHKEVSGSVGGYQVPNVVLGGHQWTPLT